MYLDYTLYWSSGNWLGIERQRLSCWYITRFVAKVPRGPEMYKSDSGERWQFLLELHWRFWCIGFQSSSITLWGNLIDLYHNFICDVWREIVFLFYFSRLLLERNVLVQNNFWLNSKNFIIQFFEHYGFPFCKDVFSLIKVCYCSRGVKILSCKYTLAK